MTEYGVGLDQSLHHDHQVNSQSYYIYVQENKY